MYANHMYFHISPIQLSGPFLEKNIGCDEIKANAKLFLTFQAFSRLWSVFSVLTLSASELSNSACCIKAVIFGSSFWRNVP